MTHKLTKTDDHVFGGNHSNNISTGYTKFLESTVNPRLPEIGERYWFSNLCTSVVREILHTDEKGFTFKTNNSTYKVEFNVEVENTNKSLTSVDPDILTDKKY